jgi:hypothetical protein
MPTPRGPSQIARGLGLDPAGPRHRIGRPTFSRVEITRAAVGLADSSGPGTVPMRRITDRKDCAPTLIYRYVQSTAGNDHRVRAGQHAHAVLDLEGQRADPDRGPSRMLSTAGGQDGDPVQEAVEPEGEALVAGQGQPGRQVSLGWWWRVRYEP